MKQKRFLTISLGVVGILALISLYSCKKNNTSPTPRPLDINKDIDGNHYDTVRIGKQLWMVQPLKVTRYNDSTPIPYIINGNDWATTTTGARCYYGNNIGGTTISTSDSDTYAATYGALYNWAAVHSGKLAPKGWHIADTTEWNTLIGTLNSNPNFTGGNDPTVGGMLKETGTTHWAPPNTGANNSSRLKTLPAGLRKNDGGFVNFSKNAYFWSSTGLNDSTAYFQSLLYNSANVFRLNNSKLLGCLVLCVQD
ncbi:MAG TPA: fibrobacter succinogenes major paralogous domain-containing protein [Chitinophagaceae bacterium]|nr:fibrobacter succinogenes major paralogous domain-containing protein [Chitinophagaceae bacterium]